MAEAVYVLCALASVVCATLLIRGYRASRMRLLFWSSLCFFGLAACNVLLVVDLVIVPDADLSLLRISMSLVSMSVLLFGLIWETR